MRIAIGGLAVECCTFSPLPTPSEDITLLRGDALRQQYLFLNDLPQVEFVPLIRGKATPGGPLEMATYQQIRDEFLAGLRDGGPWDGVYLDMHGALNVLGMDDAEGNWTAQVRDVVGADVLVGASYDLHGNVSRRVVENVDLLTAYRTAPHIDVDETRERGVRLLVDCLTRNVRPHLSFVPVPLLLPGEKAMTTAEPAGSLYARIPELIAQYGLLDASVLVGYCWADEPRVGASVVTLGEDAAQVRAAAEDLASDYWARRGAFRFGLPVDTVDGCIERAKALPEKPVFISDAGDNITGGGIGDVAYVLERLLAHNVSNCVYAGIFDAAAVETCFAAGVGATLDLSLGGKLDTLHGAPVDVTATVVTLDTSVAGNRHAVIQVGGVRVILTERRTQFIMPQQFEPLGIDPTACDIFVIKLGYLYPDIAPLAAHSIMALSPGAIDPDVDNLPYQRIMRPAYPLDADMTWNAADAVWGK
jgi:microcystin degradation protein MlrC